MRRFRGQLVWLDLSGLLAFGLLLRLPNLGRESLWYDEAVSYMAATLPVSDIAGNLVQSSHPPLYYLLLHFWRAWVPDGDAELRMLGVLWGVLLLPVMYGLAWLLFRSRALALLAATLAALSPFHLLYSHELRMYTQLMLLATAATAATWQAWHQQRFGWWLAACILWLLAVYTHLFAFLALAAAGLFSWWKWRWRREMWQTAVLVAAVLLLFAPWLLQIAQETATHLGTLRPLSQPTGRNWLKPLTTLAFLVFGQSDTLVFTGAALFLVLALLAMLLLEARRLRADGVPDGVALLLILILVSLGVPVLVYLVRPFFLPERTMAAGSPFLLMLLAWLTTRRQGPLRYLVAGTAVLLVVGALQFHWRSPIKPPYRDAMALVAARSQPGEMVLHTSDGSYLPALRYQAGPEQVLLAGDPDPRKSAHVYEALGGTILSRETVELAAGRLWLVVALEHSVAWQQAQVREFEQAYALVNEFEVGGIEIRLYERARQIAQRREP